MRSELTAVFPAVKLGKSFDGRGMAAAFALGKIETGRDFAPVLKFVEMLAVQAHLFVFQTVDELFHSERNHREPRHNEKHGRLFVQHDDAFLCCLNG